MAAGVMAVAGVTGCVVQPAEGVKIASLMPMAEASNTSNARTGKARNSRFAPREADIMPPSMKLGIFFIPFGCIELYGSAPAHCSALP